MRLRNVVFMTVVLVFIIASPAVSQQWVDIKNPKELRALHSNKTHRGTTAGDSFVEHYRADGKAIWIYTKDQRQVPCTWEVKGNEQVCVSSEIYTGCFQFQRSKKNPEEYVRRDLKNNYMWVIKVEEGIPQF